MKIGHLAAVVACLSVTRAFSTDYFLQICKNRVLENRAMNVCVDAADEAIREHCLCSSTDYHLSLFSCVNVAAEVARAPKALKQSWNVLESSCRHVMGRKYNYTFSSVRQEYRSTPAMQTFEQANQTGSGPFSCTQGELVHANVARAGESYHENIYAANIYGLALVGYVFGIIILQIILNLLSWFTPRSSMYLSNCWLGRKFRTFVGLPATFGSRRATSVRILSCWDLCFPPRLHVVLMIGFVVVEVVLLSIHYDFVVSDYMNTERVEAVTKFVGYRSGYFAMYKLPLLILFAGRNNFLIWLTGWQFDVFNHWHRWLGRLFLADLVVHASCYTRWGQWAHVLLERWSHFPPWIAAQAATIAAGFICLLANKSVRAKGYELFVCIHVLLAVFVLAGTWIHISYFGLALEPFYAALACWLVDRVARVVRVLWSGGFQASATIRSREDVLDITINYSGRWTPRGGSYVFIHFLQPAIFYQSHPFTVVPSHKGMAKNQIKLYTKVRDGVTRRMQDMVYQHGGKLVSPIWLDGPYGVEFNSRPYKEVVLIAGGIGFTGVYSHLTAMLDRRYDQAFYIHWLVTDTGFLSIFHRELEMIEAHHRVHLDIHVTRAPKPLSDAMSCEPTTAAKTGYTDYVEQALAENCPKQFVNWGRPDVAGIVGQRIRESIGPMCVFVCGPAPMSDTVRQAVVTNLTMTDNYVQFYEECFTM